MRHKASSRFWRFFEALPPDVQDLARKNFTLLKANPRHPSLHFKPVGRVWSARVGENYRALAVRREDEAGWFWIGRHDEYDRLLKQLQ